MGPPMEIQEYGKGGGRVEGEGRSKPLTERADAPYSVDETKSARQWRRLASPHLEELRQRGTRFGWLKAVRQLRGHVDGTRKNESCQRHGGGEEIPIRPLHRNWHRPPRMSRSGTASSQLGLVDENDENTKEGGGEGEANMQEHARI